MAKKSASDAKVTKKPEVSGSPDLKFKVNKVTSKPGVVSQQGRDITFPPQPIYGRGKGPIGGEGR